MEGVMIGGLTLLLVFQLVGELLVQAAKLPVPGPVLGLLLLFLTLALRGEVAAPLRDAANGLLQHFSILFVPAGAGVLLHLHRLGQDWLPIAVALVGSTALSVAVTALVLRFLLRRRGGSRS
jgi:holin-like protein